MPAPDNPCAKAALTPAEKLELQRQQLLRIAMSGVAEIEQPALGRTQYRPLEEIQQALALVDQLGGAGRGFSVFTVQSVRSNGAGRTETGEDFHSTR